MAHLQDSIKGKEQKDHEACTKVKFMDAYFKNDHFIFTFGSQEVHNYFHYILILYHKSMSGKVYLY